MGRLKKEPLFEETPSNLENNIYVLDELKHLVERFPDIKFGQILYNITPDNCITMGDLITVDAIEILKQIKNIKRKKLKDEVTYGE